MGEKISRDKHWFKERKQCKKKKKKELKYMESTCDISQSSFHWVAQLQ